jgi:hypothetical protein
MKIFTTLLLLLLSSTALASTDAPWLFEFELGYKISASRLMLASCDRTVPTYYAHLYAVEPRDGWTVNCGGDNPIYNHFLGRRCAQPLPRLVLECGWRHMSHAFDSTEMTYDAFSVRGRFQFNLRRSK